LSGEASGVAQIGNLPCRRLATGGSFASPRRTPSGLPIRDTADCQSALHLIVSRKHQPPSRREGRRLAQFTAAFALNAAPTGLAIFCVWFYKGFAPDGASEWNVESHEHH
jgi:hypothetical protein